MMVVITMSNCPSNLRGDLTRWLIEIDTGVFVGNLSTRVREAVWERICLHIKSGRATMAYSANNEQKLAFCIHNAVWEPIDYDGIKLVRRNHPAQEDPLYRKRSKIAVHHMNRLAQNKAMCEQNRYVVIDVETTGLKETDAIIELGAILITEGKPQQTFSVLVQCHREIPEEVRKLTGISEEQLAENGIELKEALEQFLAFCGNMELVGFNLLFDMRFLQRASSACELPLINNTQVDVMKLSRKKLKQCKSYSMSTVADCLELRYERRHRALDDCMLTYRIYEKLKEI